MVFCLNWKTWTPTIALFVSLASVAAFGWQQQQDAAARQRTFEDKQFQSATNKWMKVPVDVRSQSDPVIPPQRQARDAHWDSLIGASAPLSDPNAHERPLPVADALPTEPEFGDLGDGVLIIGKFESYRTVLSTSMRSVYTEIQMRVQHVFGHPNAPLRVGDLIDVTRPGGTIVGPRGRTLSYAVHPEMGIQPEHTYLIGLGYNRTGDFYLGGGKTGELWDLTHGTVKPGNSLQKARANHGLSEINGLTIDTLIQLLDKKFEDYYQAGRAD